MSIRRQTTFFYSFVIAANAMVGGMFYVLNMPLPVLAIQPVSYVVRPIIPRIIPPITGTPARLQIPDLALDLVIATGSYNKDTGNWTLSDDKAYYADASLPVNDTNGTTLVYGHARAAIFSRLSELQPGSPIIITSTDGKLFSYRFAIKKEVAPTDTSVFTADGPPTLVLQTCTGAWDTYRALYQFEYVGVKTI